MKNIVFRQA